MQGKTDDSKITVKAVVAYAAKLRLDASSQCVKDPYAKPFSPSENYAKWLASKHGPEAAISELRARAALAAREAREQAEISRRALERHKRRQAEARKDRERKVADKRPGERIDLALARLMLIASPEAANPEPSSPSADADHVPQFTVDLADRWRRKALELARELEDAVSDAKARNVQRIAA